VLDLPGARAEEAAELGFDRAALPLWLLLESAERRELPTRFEDGLDAARTERADQLTLEVGLAHVEAERFELRACARRPDTRPFESSSERIDLTDVAEARCTDVGREIDQELADRMGPSDRRDLDALAGEVPPASPCQRLDSNLVARSFDENDPACPYRTAHGVKVLYAVLRKRSAGSFRLRGTSSSSL